MSFKNWILLIGLSLLWGGSFYFIEKALVHFSFEQVVFFRVFFASLVIFVVIVMQKIPFIFSAKVWLAFLVMGLLNNVIPFLAITYAQEFITASLASLFNATTPIFTAIFAHFLTQDEKASKHKVIGIILGFIGMGILLSPQGFCDLELMAAFAILGAISYAFAGIFGKHLKEHSPMFNVFGMLSSSTVVMYLLFNPIIHQTTASSINEFSDILLLAIFSTALAYVIYFRLLFSVGAVKLLLVTYLIPISASLLGVLFLNEVFSMTMILGALFIFVSLGLINKRTNEIAK